MVLGPGETDGSMSTAPQGTNADADNTLVYVISHAVNTTIYLTAALLLLGHRSPCVNLYEVEEHRRAEKTATVKDNGEQLPEPPRQTDRLVEVACTIARAPAEFHSFY